MAQNITLLGASYSDVPSILLPKTGGGTAQFDDTTIASNAASASDILAGKLAYVNGSLITGTGTGGGGSAGTITQDGNGYLVVSDQAGGGGGGLEFEEGTFEPAEDIARPTINFAKTHTTSPFFAAMVDVTGTYDSTTYTNQMFVVTDTYTLTNGTGFYYNTTAQRYGAYFAAKRATSGTSLSNDNTLFTSIPDSASQSTANMGYYVTSTTFRPYCGSSYYWRAGRTYKWIAVWKPTT